MSVQVRGSLVSSLHTRKMHKTRLPNELHKGDTPLPNDLHNGDKMISPRENPNTHTYARASTKVTFSEMPLTMRCPGAPDDAGRFLPLQLPCRRDGSICCCHATVAIVTQRKAYHQSELTWRYCNYF